MAANHQNTYVINASFETICEIIKSGKFTSQLNLELKSTNPTPDGVWYRFHHGTSFTSWGEKITVTLIRMSSDRTTVTIHSECGMPTQIIDWGKNAQNVCNIYEYIEREARSAGAVNPAPAPAPAPAPKAPPKPKADQPILFCTNCGAGVVKGALFCVKCGKKLR